MTGDLAHLAELLGHRFRQPGLLRQALTHASADPRSGEREGAVTYERLEFLGDRVLADVMEAVIAAVYLDGGLEAARRLVLDRWHALVEAEAQPPQDAKTALQEWAQGRGLPLPSYELVEQEGPPHAPRFTMRVTVEGREPAIGHGTSKRIAEQAAAQALFEALRADDSQGRKPGSAAPRRSAAS